MTINVVILAGGFGTRLAGIWNQPKCLVPVGGRPILERLLQLSAVLEPARTVLALGHGSEAVLEWLRDWGRTYVSIVNRRGTAQAFCSAVAGLSGQVLVLNGDTLPHYDLRALVDYHNARPGSWATIAVARHPANAWRDDYAGAAVLSPEAVDEIVLDARTRDFATHLVGALRYNVPGFLDVGTPEGFRLAQEWKE